MIKTANINSRLKISSFSQTALKALREAVTQVAREHARDGRPMYVWRNGRVRSIMLKKKSAE